MGIVRKQVPAKKEPNEIRCEYLAVLPVVISNSESDAWETYVRYSIPDSYGMDFGLVDKTLGFTHATVTYKACSANSHDIKTRLRASGLHFTPGYGSRARVCGCPDGTKKCLKRTNA